jgi:transcriptional regulator with XRE-family HTH domain
LQNLSRTKRFGQNDQSMPSIGETLREARMRQRLDIADVEERTKIRAKYLRALENEEFGMLPGPTFVKTFLRTYAELLGLDPHVLVEEYRTGFEREDEMEQPFGPPGVAGRDRRHGPRPGAGSLVLLLLVGIVAALVAIGLASDDGDGGDGTSAPETTRSETEAKAPPEPARPRRVSVRVTPSAPTYICVDRGPGTPVLFEDTIDSARTFRGKRVRVNLGKRDVQVRTNGRPVEITPGPDPVGFAFTPRRSRELPVGQRPCA